jgi:hypothetical protein
VAHLAIWDVSLLMMLVDPGWHLVQEGIGAVTLGAILFPPSRKEAV